MARRMYKEMKRVNMICRDAIESQDSKKLDDAIQTLEAQPFELFILHEMKDLLLVFEDGSFQCRKLQAATAGDSIKQLLNSIRDAEAFSKTFQYHRLVPILSAAKKRLEVLEQQEKARREEEEKQRKLKLLEEEKKRKEAELLKKTKRRRRRS